MRNLGIQILLIPLTLPWHESNGAVPGDGALVQVRSCETLVILTTSTGELLLYFTVIFFLFHKKKKTVLQDCFCVPYLLQESIPSGIETYKARSSGYVGKLTERKWNPHMKSNTVRRVTLGHI